MKNKLVSIATDRLLDGVSNLITVARQKVAISLNAELTLLYWSIGDFINKELRSEEISTYGKQILATLSQELTKSFGKGYSYTALTRMSKIAAIIDRENVATLSQHLSWSHFIELSGIDNETKRLFYTQMCVAEKWSIRDLRKQCDGMLYERTAISQRPEEIANDALRTLGSNGELNPDLVFKNTYILDFLNLKASFSEKDLENTIINELEKFILELGQGFAFLERQKRLSIDTVDYYLDLLFYHRKLNRLVAIDLKLGKFKPAYKAQMELYLKYLQKHDQQPHEKSPIGLLLCSEGNTEHIELLLLGEKNIKVAQYLTELPEKQWFIDKLHRAIAIAKENQEKY